MEADEKWFDRPRQLEVLLHVLRHAPRQPGRVLDLGTGDGILLDAVLEAFPAATGVALDFLPCMLDRARERLRRLGPRAALVQADLATPAWCESVAGPFDAVVSGFAFHTLSQDRKRALNREIHALLAEGGAFVHCTNVFSSIAHVQKAVHDAATEYLFASRRERDPTVTREEVRRQFVEQYARTAAPRTTIEEQCAWLREAGFQHVECFWKFFELAIFGGVKREGESLPPASPLL